MLPSPKGPFAGVLLSGQHPNSDFKHLLRFGLRLHCFIFCSFLTALSIELGVVPKTAKTKMYIISIGQLITVPYSTKNIQFGV